MNPLIVFLGTFIILNICFRIIFLYLRYRNIRIALRKELGREPTNKEIIKITQLVLTNSTTPEIPKCPPHSWTYDKDGKLICLKCKQIPTVEV